MWLHLFWIVNANACVENLYWVICQGNPPILWNIYKRARKTHFIVLRILQCADMHYNFKAWASLKKSNNNNKIRSNNYDIVSFVNIPGCCRSKSNNFCWMHARLCPKSTMGILWWSIKCRWYQFYLFITILSLIYWREKKIVSWIVLIYVQGN